MDETLDPVALTAPVTNLPAKPGMPTGWTLTKVSQLVRDLAMNLYDDQVTLKKYGLSQADYDAFKGNEFFQRALEQATTEWNSPQSTHKRLAMEAAIAIEDALPTVAARLSKNTEPLSDVVSLVKVLSEMAGITGAKSVQQQSGPGERFKIVINLGADTIQRNATPNIVVEHDPQPAPQVALSQ